MMRKILQFALVAPLALLLFMAITGAFVALFGGVIGLGDVRTIGGVVSGMGALGFFAVLLSPLGELLGYLSSIGFSPQAQSQATQTSTTPTNSGSLGNKGTTE
jgi:hypothetical protein